MERSSSPASNTGSFGTGSSPPSSPVPDEDASRSEQSRRKKARKKRKTTPSVEEGVDGDQSHIRKQKKPKPRRKVRKHSMMWKTYDADCVSHVVILIGKRRRGSS